MGIALLQRKQGLFIVLDIIPQVLPPSGEHGMSLSFQKRLLSLHAPRILFIQLSAGFQRPPVRDLVFGALMAAMDTKSPAVRGSVKSAPLRRAR